MAAPATDRDFGRDVAVIGGGHVGLIIAAPHPRYRDLDTGKPVADVWNMAGQGVRV